MKFNEEQQAVINAPVDEISIVSASAGSGKTTTLVERIKHIVTNDLVEGQIIAISFTKAAAQSLHDKLLENLGEENMKRIRSGTFHSIFGQLIRQHADTLGIEKNFTIIDETSTHKLIEQTIAINDELNEKFENYVLEFDDRYNKKYTSKHVNNSVSLLLNNIAPEYLLKKEFPDDIIDEQLIMDKMLLDDEHFQFIVDVFVNSLIEAKKTATLTYDQILFATYLLAKNNAFDDIRNKIGYIIIDEFQDTNLIQYEIMKHLIRNNIMYIGDINQSIYEFRGAKPQIMESLSNVHKVYNMRYNYRSYQQILNHSNNLITNNSEGSNIFKPMIQGATIDKNYLGTISYRFNNSNTEATKVTEMVKKLIDVGVEPSEIAILVRNRMIPPQLTKELLLKNIELNDTTKSADFIKSETVRDVFSFLKILVNPKDIYSFMHTLDRPKKGIGAKTIEKITSKANEYNMSLVEFVLSEQVETLTPKLKKKIISYREIYTELLEAKHKGLVEIIDFILSRTGYLDWINGLKNNKSAISNLDKLRDLAEQYNQDYLLNNFDFTILDITSDFLLEFSVANKVENIDGVTISTIHNAKGLEWDFVFMVGCDDGIIPSDNLSSDRRLMYVGMTRAKIGLVLTSSKKRPFSTTPFDESQFIYESKIPIKHVF